MFLHRHAPTLDDADLRQRRSRTVRVLIALFAVMFLSLSLGLGGLLDPSPRMVDDAAPAPVTSEPAAEPAAAETTTTVDMPL
jgi:hypothetical protein